MARVGDGCNFVELYVPLLLNFDGLGRPSFLMGPLVLAGPKRCGLIDFIFFYFFNKC